MPKTYAVQCLYPCYYSHTALVEAENPEAACSAAIEQANNSPDWESVDDVGNTFVFAIGEGDVDPWEGTSSQLPVPLAAQERAEQLERALSLLLFNLEEASKDFEQPIFKLQARIIHLPHLPGALMAKELGVKPRPAD